MSQSLILAQATFLKYESISFVLETKAWAVRFFIKVQIVHTV